MVLASQTFRCCGFKWSTGATSRSMSPSLCWLAGSWLRAFQFQECWTVRSNWRVSLIIYNYIFLDLNTKQAALGQLEHVRTRSEYGATFYLRAYFDKSLQVRRIIGDRIFQKLKNLSWTNNNKHRGLSKNIEKQKDPTIVQRSPKLSSTRGIGFFNYKAKCWWLWDSVRLRPPVLWGHGKSEMGQKSSVLGISGPWKVPIFVMSDLILTYPGYAHRTRRMYRG